MNCSKAIRSKKQKHTYEYIKQYFKEKGCELLEKEYISRYTPMKYKCHCGNISKILFDSFQQRKDGTRCVKCKGVKNRGKNNYRWIKNRKIVEENEKFRQKCYKILRKSLKKTGQIKNGKTEKLLGYTYQELKDYIYNNMEWTNIVNNEWHLDHIFPIKAFVDYNIKDIKLINSLDNLQPLLKEDNLKKSYIYDKKEFEKWLKDKKIEI